MIKLNNDVKEAMTDVFIEVRLKFINEVTPQLENVIFECFELSDVQCSAIVIKENGDVYLGIYSDKLSEKDTMDTVKNKLADIMFDFKVGDK